MILWLVLGLLAALCVAALAWPLLKPPASNEPRFAHDLAVYRDQLAEIGREQARGTMSATDAASVRLEVERRILAADAASAKAAPMAGARQNWTAILGVCVLVPGVAMGLYLLVGQPDLPDQPLAARLNDPDVKMTRAVDELSARLAKAPDPKGFAMLGAAYADLARYDDSADAYRKALSLGDDSAATYSALGQSITLAGAGVAPEARTDFLKALERDPNDPRARYFIGLAEAQIGNATKALAVWRDLEKDSPAGSPWLALLDQNIAKVATQFKIDPNSVAPDRSDITRQIQDMEGQDLDRKGHG